jgi:ABC-2 type transport system ATP-binding protein
VPQSKTATISLSDLTKYYGKTLGVSGVTFDVFPGEVMGFLGPNGAGKTTAMRSLVGLLNITSGSASIFGERVSVTTHEMRSRIGYLPGSPALYENLTGREHLNFLARMRGRNCERAIVDLAARLDLDLGRHIRDLSKGNQQKVGVIQAFMHQPEVLILDEPTSGLDPFVQREFALMVDERKTQGAAILLSSHVLSEVEHLADRVVIVNQGKQLLVDEIANLKRKALRTLDMYFLNDINENAFRSIPGVSDVFGFGRRVTCSVIGAETEVLRIAVELGVESVQTHESGLDEIFFSIVDGSQST